MTTQNVTIVLKIGSGTFSAGFPVTLRILEDSRYPREYNCGDIPPASDLPYLYQNWQMHYQQLGGRGIQSVKGQVTNYSPLEDCQSALKDLTNYLRDWFAQPFFRSLQHQILVESRVGADISIPIIIEIDPARTNEPDTGLLRYIPWHLWNLFDTLPNAEIVLGMGRNSSIATPLQSPIRVLAVFGSSEGGLELGRDREALDQLKQRGAEITFLEQPERRVLHHHLWDQDWDILFFGGHSSSESGDGSGSLLQIRDGRRHLSLDDLREDLNQAIARGLKLAIFNSCDGLGIANYLTYLQVPYIVVMRELVPDRFAREFLQEFLRQFSEGLPLHLAVRRVRNRLHWLESDDEQPCPAASWMPIVCHHPTQPELIWLPATASPVLMSEALPVSPTQPSAPYVKSQASSRSPRWVIWVGIAALACVIGIALHQIVRPPPSSKPPIGFESRFSRGERQLVSAIMTPAKLEGIKEFAQGDYKKAAEWFEASLKLNRNDPETLIYLNNARSRAAQRQTNAIATSVPIGNNPNVAQEMLRGVAQAQDEINQKGGINGVRLEVQIINDDNDPTVTKQVAELLIKDHNLLAMIGHNTGDTSLSAAPIYQDHGIVMISPTTFDASVSKVGNYIFRVVPTPQSMAVPLAEYVLKRSPQPTKILLCYDSTAPDQAMFRDSFVDGLTNQGGEFIKVVDQQGRDQCDYASAAFDPEQSMSKAIAQGANSIFLGTNVNNFDPTLRIIRINDRRLPMFSSPTLYTQQIILEARQAIKGLILVAPWNPDAYPKFANRSRDLWGATVNWRTATAYDATSAVIAGLQQSSTRKGLQQALASDNFSAPGSGEPVRFLGTRDRRLTPVLVQVQSNSSGGYRFVYLPSPSP
jgi:branched-chain amino acid transport system substrate-binding protein